MLAAEADHGVIGAVCTPLITSLQGQVTVPSTSQLLPEDLQNGGVALAVDTLNGATLHVILCSSGRLLWAVGLHQSTTLVAAGKDKLFYAPSATLTGHLPLFRAFASGAGWDGGHHRERRLLPHPRRHCCFRQQHGLLLGGECAARRSAHAVCISHTAERKCDS